MILTSYYDSMILATSYFLCCAVWPGAVPLAPAAPAAASAGSARERSLAGRWGPAAYLASHPPWWSRQHPQAWWKVKKMKELADYLIKKLKHSNTKRIGSMIFWQGFFWHKLPQKNQTGGQNGVLLLHKTGLSVCRWASSKRSKPNSMPP